MIGQYLSNKNESATVAKTQKFYKLNKALFKNLASLAYSTRSRSHALSRFFVELWTMPRPTFLYPANEKPYRSHIDRTVLKEYIFYAFLEAAAIQGAVHL